MHLFSSSLDPRPQPMNQDPNIEKDIFAELRGLLRNNWEFPTISTAHRPMCNVGSNNWPLLYGNE